ncbi:MAG: hypothetical protein NT150_09785 [Bacteroidetes bacterium]|nr:hypothetical protein [Bacteroidota bacterium]
MDKNTDIGTLMERFLVNADNLFHYFSRGTQMKKALILLVLIFNLNTISAATHKRMEIALCVDLSASTTGVLEALRTNMWYLMYYLTAYQPQPDVYVGLVLYGKPGYGVENDYVKIVSDFSKNINFIQQELYSTQVTINAKENFPERALLKCLTNLSWSKEPETYRSVVIIGNGSITGNEYMADAVKISLKKQIVVNTIYFQTYQSEREVIQWERVAKACNGIATVIDPAVAQPWEKDIKSSNSDFIAEVNDKYNSTFMHYGTDGNKKFAKYMGMDDFARETGPICLEFRLMYKISENYLGVNKDWDLVDLSIVNGKIDTNHIDKKTLPIEYQNMSFKDIVRLVNLKKEERLYLQEITNIVAQRNKMLTREYYQEYRPIIKRSFYIILMEIFNAQTDNFHEILD